MLRKLGGEREDVINIRKRKKSKLETLFIFNTQLIIVIRLHREALKQSAIDPLSGKIDISILTTGISLAARKRRQELVEALKKLIKGKDKTPTLNYQKIFTELKESSSTVLIYSLLFVFVIHLHF